MGSEKKIIVEALHTVASILRGAANNADCEWLRQHVSSVAGDAAVQFLPCADPALRRGVALLLIVRQRMGGAWIGDLSGATETDMQEWARQKLMECRTDYLKDIELACAEAELGNAGLPALDVVWSPEMKPADLAMKLGLGGVKTLNKERGVWLEKYGEGNAFSLRNRQSIRVNLSLPEFACLRKT